MTYFEIIRDVVLLALGATGTFLSIHNYRDLKGKSARSLRISVETALPTYHDLSVGEFFLKVIVTNNGHRDVTITNMGIETPKKQTIAFMTSNVFPGDPDTRVPAKLTDGEIAYRYYPYRGISEALLQSGYTGKVRLTVFAVDSAGRRHYGEKMKWDTKL